ncbi:hypothetical protein PR003_g11165 [Phytophthora rubi]|uniref:Uncharacterized protein n=1 Tax=Phytophthora rubi TaxID=129364 RepID=A0A6A3MEA7_9STRA|nr:hypothetical protein PR001_g21156 [Phytophthora rubi]KAE9028428.1 hypothetical protein PR002_g10391 [Phytophthora rubi]KAE9339143.1 hypothetical protein PR003_g11165 [Phytophthora rubi]
MTAANSSTRSVATRSGGTSNIVTSTPAASAIAADSSISRSADRSSSRTSADRSSSRTSADGSVLPADNYSSVAADFSCTVAASHSGSRMSADGSVVAADTCSTCIPDMCRVVTSAMRSSVAGTRNVRSHPLLNRLCTLPTQKRIALLLLMERLQSNAIPSPVRGESTAVVQTLMALVV